MSVNEQALEIRDTAKQSGVAEPFVLPRCETDAARFIAQRGRAGTVLTVTGEVDAANADRLADYGRECVASCDWLVVDLAGLAFIGVAGFSALHTINTRCVCTNVNWTIVPSAAVSRLLRVCDPDGRLPLADSVSLALAAVQREQQPMSALLASRR